MHTVPLSNNFISERVDLRIATALTIDVGWRTSSEASQFLSELSHQFATKGFPNIVLRAEHNLRRGMIIVGPIAYKMDMKISDSIRKLRILGEQQYRFEKIIGWCETNCTAEVTLDGAGLTFHNDDDLLLFKLAFDQRTL